MTWILPVRVFARLRELAGADVLDVSVPIAASVSDVRRAIELQIPATSGLLANSAIAVNNEYAHDEHPVRPGDEVAVIPPVSGGSTRS